MVMGPHIRVRLEHDFKPLDRICRAFVQQQMRALTRRFSSSRRQLCDLVPINDLYVVRVRH